MYTAPACELGLVKNENQRIAMHACMHAHIYTHTHAPVHYQYTCITFYSDSPESLPQELGSGIPLLPLKQDPDSPSSSLKQKPQEMVGKLEHKSSDQGLFVAFLSSKF